MGGCNVEMACFWVKGKATTELPVLVLRFHDFLKWFFTSFEFTLVAEFDTGLRMQPFRFQRAPELPGQRKQHILHTVTTSKTKRNLEPSQRRIAKIMPIASDIHRYLIIGSYWRNWPFTFIQRMALCIVRFCFFRWGKMIVMRRWTFVFGDVVSYFIIPPWVKIQRYEYTYWYRRYVMVRRCEMSGVGPTNHQCGGGGRHHPITLEKSWPP